MFVENFHSSERQGSFRHRIIDDSPRLGFSSESQNLGENDEKIKKIVEKGHSREKRSEQNEKRKGRGNGDSDVFNCPDGGNVQEIAENLKRRRSDDD